MNKFFKPLAIVLLILTAINAVIAGFLFIIDPSGNKMGMHVEYLKYSPFKNYFIPGIVLLVVNGILNINAAYRVIKNKKQYPYFVTIQGFLLCGWIFIQVVMVRDITVLHVLMFTIGLILILLGFLLGKQNV